MSKALTTELTAPNGRKYTQPLGLFINNEWVAGRSEKKIETINPADESFIAAVHTATAEDVDDAVDAARAALEGSWQELSGTERGALLHKLEDLIEAEKETLATIETWDNGKPYKTSLTEDVVECSNTFRYYAGWADKIHGQVLSTEKSQFVYTVREPVGVCGLIVPWNYPLAIAVYKLAPALAAGATVVLKPSEVTPLSVLYLATLFKRAGFPPGVVNIVNGLGSSTGAAIASHPRIDKISFTGSTATGSHVMKLASVNLKNITLETGGKSPALVFDDADLAVAAEWGRFGIMVNAGQACSATSRILVQENVYDRFVELFKEATLKVTKVGGPWKDDISQGPQVSQAQFDRILSYIESGKREGATVSLGGKAFRPPHGKGFFIEPTVFTKVTDDMAIYREEIFGPVVVICSFKTEAEAISRANDTTYGLGAAIFTENGARGHRVARKIQAGSVWINSSNNADYRVPFGGLKQSCIGSDCGEAALLGYTVLKSIYAPLQ